jgi:hypothetical protein
VLLLAAVGLVVVGVITLVIGLVGDSVEPLYASMASSFASAVTLTVVSRRVRA